jgi:hypothetical protein
LGVVQYKQRFWSKHLTRFSFLQKPSSRGDRV